MKHKCLNHILIITLLVFLVVFQGDAQNAINELEEVFAKIQNLKNLSFDMEAKVFIDKNDKYGVVARRASLWVSKSGYRSKMGSEEIVVGGKKMLSIDHKNKLILVGRTPPDSEEPSRLPIAFDSLKKVGGVVEFVGTKNQNRHFRITIPEGLIHIIDLHVNEKDMITRYVFWYQDLEEIESAYYKSEVTYSNISFSPINKEVFSLNQFFSESKNKLKGKGEYKDYAVHEIEYESAFDDFNINE